MNKETNSTTAPAKHDKRTYALAREAIDHITSGKQALRNLKVIRSERLVGEIGEWFAEELLGAKRADSTSQAGYDNRLGDLKIQVKTHAKGDDNNARWTEYRYDRGVFDELIILVFSKEFYLKEFYRIPEEIAYNSVDRTKKQTVLKWDNMNSYRIELDDLPNQNLVMQFID